ncbi:MAG TPA: ABC transporter permease [Puia sp.]|nr:ABC transporter permease [Puia sp.]
MHTKTEWEWEIRPDESWFRLNLGALWHYKDLLFRLVRRDIIASYQQTILGPAWVFLQPLFTTFVYFIIFRKIANLSTDGIPPILFYLPGTLIWTYFSDCFIGVMYTFTQNAYIFNKVYFPRLIVPLSTLLFHSFRLGIQLLLFLILYLFFLVRYQNIHPSLNILLLPLLIILVAGFAMGSGLIISVLTARYRDLDNIMQFLLRLFMFAAPIVYPASMVPGKFRFLFWLNPLTPVIESFRAAFFTGGDIYVRYLLISVAVVSAVLLTGLVLFKKYEIKVMDIV